MWGNSFLPGVFQGCHINNGKIDPQTVIQHVHNSYLPPAAQRKQLDLLQQLNREHLEARQQDGQLEARIESLEMAFRMQFAAQEVVRPEPRNGRHAAKRTARVNSPTPVWWRGGWWSAACEWCRSISAAGSRGTITATS